METTRTSLLYRVSLSENPAWEEFYAIYWAPIIRYARKLGLQESEAHDVLQETMVALMGILPKFQYDRKRGKFRNFLLTIVHRKCLAVHRRTKRKAEVAMDQPVGESGLAPIERLAQEESSSEPDESAWQEALMLEAIKRLEADPRIKPESLAAFRAYVIDGQAASDVARKFGLKVNALYQIRNRLIKKLQEEVAVLMRQSRLEE